MKKEKVVAMLLAGGQGTRLKSLTKNVAKPAVPFGGKYRIIDFPLSNAANSGITDIGILTQYKPFLLNEHIGIGSHWDFDRSSGGLRILSPFAGEAGGRWYQGTANAIYENMNFINHVNPNYVLILSGDHIYKMDYKKMLDYHIEKQAHCTISVIQVPWDEASRFGIMDTDEFGRITEFAEKPEKPKSNLASMGIYIFNWDALKAYLEMDVKNPDSSNDFGKDIIPTMLADKNNMYAYTFEGYWKDVGTVRSYWEANMDLLSDDNELDLYCREWRIFTKNRNLPPQYVTDQAVVKNSMINEGCIIDGHLEKSILFSEVRVDKGAKVYNSVILSGAIIEEGAKVCNAVVMEGVRVKKAMSSEKKTANTSISYLKKKSLRTRGQILWITAWE
ncbi:glucose-1-phosphate adenylyltransferase [Alkalibacter saccharofermentans]|uniref:Glucose-1-phosphate adenylyltransferase n=1 Tax=Alkalibacter saccharofermentans DSM 14828 TaxID=1120975 RepID=A0A1M4S9N7_9FIRM|nr:glucose-1-phosphate adenylyltransferase [Alkalibacter saccharofermentans]SHE28855.1 glucose-1-phosphate adenylyltransferase [Alkalibacter saccharofermentans DSM 14828]